MSAMLPWRHRKKDEQRFKCLTLSSFCLMGVCCVDRLDVHVVVWWRVDTLVFTVQVCYRVEVATCLPLCGAHFGPLLLINGCGLSCSCCAYLPRKCLCVWCARVAHQSTWFIMGNMFDIWKFEKRLIATKYTTLMLSSDGEDTSNAIPRQEAKNMLAKTGESTPMCAKWTQIQHQMGQKYSQTRLFACILSFAGCTNKSRFGPKSLENTAVLVPLQTKILGKIKSFGSTADWNPWKYSWFGSTPKSLESTAVLVPL